MKKPLHLHDLKAALETKPVVGEKSEAAYKRDLVAQVNALPGARARRIEDKWATGILDLTVKMPGLPLIMAEGKIIHGNLFAPTPAQYQEGVKWIAARVECVLIGWKRGQMYVSPWVEQADCRECLTLAHASYGEILWEFLRPAPSPM